MGISDVLARKVGMPKLEKPVEMPRPEESLFVVRPKKLFPFSFTGSVTAGSTLTRKIKFDYDVYIKDIWISFARNQKRQLRVYLKKGANGTSDDPDLIKTDAATQTPYFVGDGETVPLLDLMEYMRKGRYLTVYADNQDDAHDLTLDVKGTVREV